ncbi:hypothetical protein GCM10010965_11870 [Caldalkalibacillus thermarum]|uniref:hypothetical protein n=1 Tax=Caldalkalibacillus thermarum TaxID=296745 RepID=UPI0016667C69|nr:hypothetical protein [Caldalkalibacillus thermarum]GGK20469.1 hypothetical protein GCM10010965_11870 [Caldalkalibacillus thermarum]
MNTKALCTVFLIFSLVLSQGLLPFFSFFHPKVALAKTNAEFPAYPINPRIQFVHNAATFSLQKLKKDRYTLRLAIESMTNIPVDQRLDLTLLFTNGTLAGYFVTKGHGQDTLREEHLLEGNESAKYEAITYHYAVQIQNTGKVSQNAMSYDHVYLLSSALSQPTLFRQPKTNTQKQWQRILDHAIKQQKKYEQKQLLQKFKLTEQDYFIYPLDELTVYANDHLPTFSAQETKELLGHIWHQLYIHYVLGQVQDKRYPIDTRGSHMPLVVIARDHSHFHLLFRTRSGNEHKVTEALASTVLHTHAAHIR